MNAVTPQPSELGRVPAISVVLSTFRRAETLRRTLEHLIQQDLAADEFEVLVVDDGSPDETAEVVAQAQSRAPFHMRYIRHDNHGPGYTQNRGIEAARAPVVLLMADDIFLTPQAVREHLRCHQDHPQAEVAVLGKVVQSPDLTETVFLSKWDPFRFDELEGLAELPPYRFFAMNISVKRDFVMRHGMYLEHRGRGGPSCMEDLELGIRLHQHGMRLLYAPAALAAHHHVVTLDQAIQRWYERGLNYGEFRRHAPMPELTVYFHVLDRHTVGEYLSVLRGKNWFRGHEKSAAWHFLRHGLRMLSLNKLTERLLWRPVLDLAERSQAVAGWLTAKHYRAFLYYHFLRGVDDGRRIYGD